VSTAVPRNARQRSQQGWGRGADTALAASPPLGKLDQLVDTSADVSA
jgi:hypothetical protein